MYNYCAFLVLAVLVRFLKKSYDFNQRFLIVNTILRPFCISNILWQAFSIRFSWPSTNVTSLHVFNLKKTTHGSLIIDTWNFSRFRHDDLIFSWAHWAHYYDFPHSRVYRHICTAIDSIKYTVLKREKNPILTFAQIVLNNIAPTNLIPKSHVKALQNLFKMRYK